MARRISSKRFEEAIEAFQETLESFCEMMLPGGRRSGNKWICGDLHDGEGKSCAVFLDTGGFNDTNPAADHVKGGPIDLWKAIFSVSTITEVIEGMEAWVENGSLPNGAKGMPTARRIEISPGEMLVAQDAYEKAQIQEIHQCKGVIEFHRHETYPYAHIPRPPNSQCIAVTGDGEYDMHSQEFWDYSRARTIPRMELLIRACTANIWQHRWTKAAEDTIRNREEAAHFLAELRGLSPEVFLWLIDTGNVALYKAEKVSKEGNKFDDIEIAFPVTRAVDRKSWPDEREIEFLGMHLKWFGTEKSGWRYEPKGTPALPLVIGDVGTAEVIGVSESTWDVIAFIDLHRLFETPEPWAVISTRGASNTNEWPDIPPTATVLFLLQNDKANAKWFEKVPPAWRDPQRGRTISPPAEYKDLNDWMRAVDGKTIRKILAKEYREETGTRRDT